MFCVGIKRRIGLALSLKKLLQRQYHMLHVRKTVSQYNTRHMSLSSACPVLLINMYFSDLKSGQSSGEPWGKFLEGMDLLGL